MNGRQKAVASNTTAVLSAALQQRFAANLSLFSLKPVAIQSALPRSTKSRDVGEAKGVRQTPAQQLSLGQRLGLDPPPPAKLTNEQWHAVQVSSQLRAHSQFPCPICQDAFRLEPQVMLSCGHVFHAACFGNFEKFATGHAGPRSSVVAVQPTALCCPVCRTANYEKRIVTDGALCYRTRCATLIQSLYRGFRVRRRYWRYLPRTKARWDKTRSYAIFKLTSATTRLMKMMDSHSDSLDALLAECDRTVSMARATLHQADVALLNSLTDEKWEQVRAVAAQRCVPDCPICMMAFAATNSGPAKPQVLLSCSHVFHVSCLQSFETFALSSGGNANCPICREPYQKLVVQVN